MASTLTVTPVDSFTQHYLARHSSTINAIAQLMGVPPTAISGAVAEEMRNVYVDGNKAALQTLLDWNATQYGHAGMAADFAKRRSDIEQGVRPSDPSKLLYPTANDIGPGNINLGQAILQLQRYLADPAYASDPLNLRQYQSDYAKFAKDLVDLNSPTTFAVAGLVLKQGVVDYTRIFGAQFTNAPVDVQSALLTTYFKQGKGQFSQKHPLTGAQLLPYPHKGDGGPFILDPSNFKTLLDTLNGPFLFDGILPDPTVGIQRASVDRNVLTLQEDRDRYWAGGSRDGSSSDDELAGSSGNDNLDDNGSHFGPWATYVAPIDWTARETELASRSPAPLPPPPTFFPGIGTGYNLDPFDPRRGMSNVLGEEFNLLDPRPGAPLQPTRPAHRTHYQLDNELDGLASSGTPMFGGPASRQARLGQEGTWQRLAEALAHNQTRPSFPPPSAGPSTAVGYQPLVDDGVAHRGSDPHSAAPQVGQRRGYGADASFPMTTPAPAHDLTLEPESARIVRRVLEELEAGDKRLPADRWLISVP